MSDSDQLEDLKRMMLGIQLTIFGVTLRWFAGSLEATIGGIVLFLSVIIFLFGLAITVLSY
jgi:hypothetical protein